MSMDRPPLTLSITLSTAQPSPIPATAFDRYDGRVGVLKVSSGKMSYRASPTTSGPVTLPRINQGLGFWAYGVYVDNLTNQWLYVPSSGSYVPPNRTGVAIRLPGTQVAEGRFEPPPGSTQPAPLPNQMVSLTFTEEAVQQQGGTAFTPT